MITDPHDGRKFRTYVKIQHDGKVASTHMLATGTVVDDPLLVDVTAHYPAQMDRWSVPSETVQQVIYTHASVALMKDQLAQAEALYAQAQAALSGQIFAAAQRSTK